MVPPAPSERRLSRSPSRSSLSSLSRLELSPEASGAGFAASASRALASAAAFSETSVGNGLSSAVDFLGCAAGCCWSGFCVGDDADVSFVGLSVGAAGGGQVLLVFHGPFDPRCAPALQLLSGCVEGACGEG